LVKDLLLGFPHACDKFIKSLYTSNSMIWNLRSLFQFLQEFHHFLLRARYVWHLSQWLCEHKQETLAAGEIHANERRSPLFADRLY